MCVKLCGILNFLTGRDFKTEEVVTCNIILFAISSIVQNIVGDIQSEKHSQTVRPPCFSWYGQEGQGAEEKLRQLRGLQEAALQGVHILQEAGAEEQVW